MLENLLNLLKEQGQESIVNNPQIPNEQNDAVLADATHSVAEGLQSELAGGGIQNVVSLFGKNDKESGGIGNLINNPIVSKIINSFTGKLTANHGVSEAQASGIAGSLIPNVIGSLINKTNDPGNSSFSLEGIIGSLTGGNSKGENSGFDLGGLLSKFSQGGLDANSDGKIGMDDILDKIKGGAAQQQQTQAGGGGMMDLIKGFLK